MQFKNRDSSLCVPKAYIAGPFFNQLQIDLIKEIETAFVNRHAPFFSPRRQAANKPGEITRELAAEILKNNTDNMDECDYMVAVLDWVLPPNVGMYVIQDAGLPMAMAKYDDLNRKLERGDVMAGTCLAGPVLLPDSGTVFEMGYMTALKKPVYGFTTRPTHAPLNVMLGHSCQGIITSVRELSDMLRNIERGEVLEPALEFWPGKNQ